MYLPQLSPEFVARSLSMVTPGNPMRAKQPFTFVTTDSRAVRPGCLFVALKGETHDGHTFIDTAIGQGARGVICKRGSLIQDAKDVCVFPTDDTLSAFRKLAMQWRKEFTLPVVAVGGSVGKTTTKELLAAVLKGKWEQVLKTTGSQNGYVGIPITLLELRPEHGCAVIEVGIDEPGAMAEHVQLVHPNLSLLTAIAEEHLEKLKDLPTVAHEEGELLRWTAQSGGTLCLQMDDPWIRPHFNTLRVGNKITVGMAAITPYDFTGTVTEKDGKESLRVDYRSRTSNEASWSEDFPLPLPGEHNARNLLLALAAAHALGVTPPEMKKGLSHFTPAFGRSETKRLGSWTLLCDYYNANPASVRAGLSLLAQTFAREAKPGQPGKKIAVLGDMLELGPDEGVLHARLAEALVSCDPHSVLLLGDRMNHLEARLKELNWGDRVQHFGDQDSLSKALIVIAQPGDVILIKGSRGMKMERIEAALQAHAQSDVSRSSQSGPSATP